MTVLACLPDYLAEYEARGRLLTIARRSDGQCVAFTGPGIAGLFRDCLRTHGAARTVATFIRWARDDWRPLYKPAGIARLIAEHLPQAQTVES